MLSFLSKFTSVVRGVLSGFDRVFLCGNLRNLSYPLGLQNYLWAQRVPFKDFDKHSEQVTARLVEASLRQARQLRRDIIYIKSPTLSKEDIARKIAERDRIRKGLICVLRSVDPCMSFQISKNHRTRKLEIHYGPRKCLHLYHYQIHPVFGFMHARIQTWFPFGITVCINGREWLARQMDQANLHYVRRDNTFTWLEDNAGAQTLFHQQLQTNWPALLNEVAVALNPAQPEILARFPCNYYWTASETEWASDIMFDSAAALGKIYHPLIRYAINTFKGVDVMRFLGLPVPASGKVPHWRRHEISSNIRERSEGVRIKHWLNGNSLKLYDKGSVLRTECLIRDPQDFKVYRSIEGDPEGPKDWRPLRKGIIDLPLRSEVSQAANERYLEALTAVHDTVPLAELVEPLCRPGQELQRSDGGLPSKKEFPSASDTASDNSPSVDTSSRPRRVRALNPLAAADAALLEAVARPEFFITGMRNRDLRRLLYRGQPATQIEERRRSAAVTRQIRLLRVHGLIYKVDRTHCYKLTKNGLQAITALLAARKASTEAMIRYAG